MRRYKGRISALAFAIVSFVFTTSTSFGQCPVSACTPSGPSTGGISGGIFNVTFGSINHNTGGEATTGSYVDYACTRSTTVLSGSTVSISISTGAALNENVRVWIDWNNDGFLNNFTEVIFTSAGKVHTGNITIPSAGITKNIPLRMRVGSDWTGSVTPTPCNTSFYGQHEDYAVTVIDNVFPPSTDFTVSTTNPCSGNVQFTDLTTGSATAWKWYFGDGDSSTVQNPFHVYTGAGPFTVTLITTNSFGNDTLTKSNYISNGGVSPVAPSCTPGTAPNAGLGFDCGIYSVSLNTLNRSSGGDTEGYQDYSCVNQTTLFEGVPYSISINTGTQFDEAVKVWVDLNADGTFTANELLFTSASGKVHTGNLTIPGGAIKDSLLRMRVAADYIGEPSPTACSTPQYSQVEDYAVIVITNTNPPAAEFEVDNAVTCDGTVNFTDLSTNGATSWQWDFGDMTTSTSQNPSHTYVNLGTYTITMKAFNANGSDSITKVDYVTFHDTIPVSACTPVTSNYCCGYGIRNFTFNDINNTTSDGSVGYEDYTCTIRTRINEGQSYPVSLLTGLAGNQTSRVWIDFNNDGQFTDSTELIYEAVDVKDPSGNTIISTSGNIVYDTPLRLRVISDYAASSFTSCFNIIHGQAEDYTVIVAPNALLPVADFTVDEQTDCDATFEFTNLSQNVPTSYIWDFGDGTTDTTADPTHTYADPGMYTVTLVATNAVGSDTITKTNYINYLQSPKTACVPTTISYCCNTGIKRLRLGTIDNSSDNASIPYEDFSCIISTTLQAGEKHPVFVTTGNQISEHVVMWIDLNNDGSFDNNTELVYSSTALANHADSIEIPQIAEYDTTLRLRVTSERASSAIPTACSDLFNGQHEDYAVIITAPDSTNSVAEAAAVAFDIYPNPAKDVVHIRWDDDLVSVRSVSVMNMVGEQMLRQTRDVQNINTGDLKPGMYVLTITTEKEVYSQKIIIK